MSSLRKIPCNGCRERKRKCSYEQPCARCIKFHLECVYTVMTSPKDIEYLQELEYLQQIESMQQEISTMENEMRTLKLAQMKIAAVNTSTTDDDDSYVYHDYPSPVSMNIADLVKSPRYPHHLFHSHHQLITTKHEQPDHCLDQAFCNPESEKTIAKRKSIKATVSKPKESEPWTLTVKNGNMSIETHIKSYDDLMGHFKGMISTCLYQESTSHLPFPLPNEIFSAKSSIEKAFCIFIWRKYGKSRFKSLTKYTPVLLHYDPVDPLVKIEPAENIANITMRLVFTYVHCFHLKTLYLHVPSFVKLFMADERQVMKSPGVMALCGLICHQPCKHLLDIIPLDALNDYGNYYFERARELVTDQFDEANLDTMMTYTFMSVFKIKTSKDQEAEKYLSIAERIYNILLPQYKFKDGVPQSDESILFARLYRCLTHARSVIHLHMLMNRMFRTRSSGPKIFHLLETLNDTDVHIYTAADDSLREIQFIKMKRYLYKLRETIKEGGRYISAQDLPSYVGEFSHQVEMAMRHWYRNILPPDFQLKLPLFQDDSSDIEFFTNLELECGDSPIPLLLRLSLYNEYLIVSKSYLPKDPDHDNLKTNELLELYKSMRQSPRGCSKPSVAETPHHWLKIVDKIKHFRKFHDNDSTETDDNYVKKMIQAIDPSKLNFNLLQSAHTSIKIALNTVRMVQFLLSRDYACFLDLRWIMNSWEILLRAARFKYQQPGDGEVTLDKIRANLILCLNIIRDQLKLSRRDSSGSLVDVLQQEFNGLF
ncbi:hypothetical protein HPULCUR_004426 [Helicostylum pulchrum]|uniref:Zn(2)-C6 fungal-type domain-containing protein n=1 Tax=Helicostylum pulchrum TaxID=562976 RepID=A0ABP9XW62_9FUNG